MSYNKKKAKGLLLASAITLSLVLQFIPDSSLIAADFLEDEIKWKNVTPDDEKPIERRGHTAVLVEDKNEMIVFGGFGAKKGNTNDTWIFDIKDEKWKEVTPKSQLPPPRMEHTAIYDKKSDTMIIFGGWQKNGAVYKDVWALTNIHTDNPLWSKKKNAPVPLGYSLRGSSAVWTGQRMIIFGGMRDDRRVFGRTMIYDIKNDEWSFFDGGPARYDHTAVWTGDDMIVFSGRGRGHTLRNDVWILKNALSSPVWEEMIKNSESSTVPEKRSNAIAAYDKDDDQMLIFGGNGIGKGVNNDLWVLKDAKKDRVDKETFWRQLFPRGETPPIREDFAGVYNEKDTLVIFGGEMKKGRRGLLNDTWKLIFTAGDDDDDGDDDKPKAPTNVSVSSKCESNEPQNKIIWDDKSDNEDKFEIFRDKKEFDSIGKRKPIGKTGENETSFTDKTADEGVKYFYRVAAKNENGASIDKTDPQANVKTKECDDGDGDDENNIPLALAGQDHDIKVNATHKHTGASAEDKDGNLKSFKWEFISCPDICPALTNDSGSISGSSANIDGPSYKPNKEGRYKLRLTVKDGKDEIDTDTLIETAEKEDNKKPIADARVSNENKHPEDDTEKVKISSKSIAFLWGEDSSDPDGNTPLTFKWTCAEGELSSDTEKNPIFTAPEVEDEKELDITCSLNVKDSLGLKSNTDKVRILVKKTAKPTLFVNLTTDLFTGEPPLSPTLKATVFGTAKGNINYYFWWDCPNSGINLEKIIDMCGDPEDSKIGKVFKDTPDETKSATHTYTTYDFFVPKVIIERDGADNAEDRVNITVGKLDPPPKEF